MSHNYQNLAAHIVPLSEAHSFESAKLEWEFDYVYFTEDFGACPCGHAIKEHCVIRNSFNGNVTHVGNVCVNKFMGITTQTLVDGLKRIIKDPHANANEAVVLYAQHKGFIYPNEVEFLLSTKNKRKLSLKQQEWKRKINWRIINAVMV